MTVYLSLLRRHRYSGVAGKSLIVGEGYLNQDVLLVDIKVQSDDLAVAEAAIEQRLKLVNTELERYTCKATMSDYALAIASGILAGAIDAMFVGEAPLFGGESTIIPSRTPANPSNTVMPLNAGAIGAAALQSRLSYAVRAAYDLAEQHKGMGDKYSRQLDRFLKQNVKRPTPLGLASAISIQLLRALTYGSRVASENPSLRVNMHDAVKQLLLPAAIVGFLDWIAVLSKMQNVEIKEQLDDDQHDLNAIVQLALSTAGIKIIDELRSVANAWHEDCMRDFFHSKRRPSQKFDVTEILLSLFKRLAYSPSFERYGLPSHIASFGGQAGYRRSSGTFGTLSKQAIPVLLNEVIVRMGYFVSRLASEFKNGAVPQEIRWQDIIPINNRTVDRMMTFASMTLTVVDTADAATHAIVESEGDWVLYAQKFVARYNYVAIGRAVITVVREVSDEAIEAHLIHQKRLLTEAHATLVIERLEEYKVQLSEKLDEYLVEHLTTFFEGISFIDQGLAAGDSDLVIAGNVTIQRALNREPQFTNQEEFDELMLSDDDFIF